MALWDNRTEETACWVQKDLQRVLDSPLSKAQSQKGFTLGTMKPLHVLARWRNRPGSSDALEVGEGG